VQFRLHNRSSETGARFQRFRVGVELPLGVGPVQLPFILASPSNITRFRSAVCPVRHRRSANTLDARTKTTRDDIDLDLYQGGTNGLSVSLRLTSAAEVTELAVCKR
jgi:hypothetical protein